VKLEIFGVPHDHERALHKAQLSDLYDLKLASGIGVKSIMAGMERLYEAANAGRDAMEDAVGEADVILAIQGLVFLCRRAAGETLTYKEASVSYSDLRWAPDEDDVEPDPTVASGDQTAPSPETVSDENSSAPKPSKARSKTSKSPSTTTS
jgi:hypothetical protein